MKIVVLSRSIQEDLDIWDKEPFSVFEVMEMYHVSRDIALAALMELVQSEILSLTNESTTMYMVNK